MADMDVTAKFRADISDMKSKMDTISRDLSQINTKAQSAGKGFTVLRGSIATAFGSAIVGGIAAGTRALSGFLQGAVDMAKESELTVARLDAIATSMGLMDTVLGGSTQRLLDQAQALQEVTGVSDETIKSAQALILTFQSVGATAGETGGIFDRTTAAAMDLSAAGFGDVEGAAKSLARALEDPTRGLTMLSRQGVTFDKAQQDMIKGLVASGQTLEAQEMILAAVEKQVGGTAEAVAKDSDKMSAAFADLQEGIGLALFPVLQELAATLTPIIKDLQGPLSEVAKVVAGALQKAFAELGPLIGPLATALAAIGQAITTALAGALEALIPALVPVAQNLTELANRIAPILAAVLSKVGEILGRVLGAITPLLGPLTDLVFGILDAAWPIVETVADVLLLLVDALKPVLNAVMMLIKPIGDLVKTGLAIILPVIKPLLPVIEALAQVLSHVLVKAVGLVMIAMGHLIQVWSKIAPFVLNNVAKPVVQHFMRMANMVVGAASRMLGWVPGLGDALKKAEKAVQDFAVESERAIGNAADAIEKEGGRIGQEMITQGTNALTQATPALGAAAAQAGRFVAGQYNHAVASGMGAAFGATFGAGAGITPPAMLTPTPPTPPPDGGGGGSAVGQAAEQDTQAIEKLIRKLEEYQDSMHRVQRASEDLHSATRVLPPQFQHLGDVLGDLAQSQIQQIFGPGGSITQVIGQFDQLSASIDEFYQPLLNVEMFGRKAVRAARQAMNATKGFLQAATETALRLMAQRERIRTALRDLETEYRAGVERVNQRFNDLDRAAANATRALERQHDGIIAALQRGLASATAAFDRENAVLQSLIQERNSFLANVRSGFRSFVNSLSFESQQATKKIVKETKKLANGITVTFEREIEVGGGAKNIREQLEQRLAAVREFSANIRTLMRRGLDPTLVQDFVSAGVAGAGEAVKELTKASDADLAAINSAQAGLASEVAAFQQYAGQQWFDAGIAQQAAIVRPLEAARDAAQFALDTANALREQEIEAARAHQEQLKLDREAALAEELANYTTRKEQLEQEGEEVEDALTENANMINERLSNLQNTLPPRMARAGRMAMNGLIRGLKARRPALMREARRIANAISATIRAALATRSPSRVTADIGEDVAAGLAQGMKKGTSDVLAQARNLSSAAVPPMPRIGAPSAGANITVNITAPPLTDPAEIGRQAVEAIRKYERRSGPVFVSAQ